MSRSNNLARGMSLSSVLHSFSVLKGERLAEEISTGSAQGSRESFRLLLTVRDFHSTQLDVNAPHTSNCLFLNLLILELGF